MVGAGAATGGAVVALGAGTAAGGVAAVWVAVGGGAETGTGPHRGEAAPAARNAAGISSLMFMANHGPRQTDPCASCSPARQTCGR